MRDFKDMMHHQIKEYCKNNLIMMAVVLFHLLFVFFLQLHADISGDGIFTYTLANNPYAYEYIDPQYKYLPESNGWIDADFLKESYTVEDYNQFNYSGAYFHQRIDNHPLAYYFLVHTVSSMEAFNEGKSMLLVTMLINLIFICAVDILLIKFFYRIFGNKYYSAVAFVGLFLLLILQQLYILPRMYMMLAFFCLWYLYIHYELLAGSNQKEWRKSTLVQMAVCIAAGSQTHYYFYVWALALTVSTAVYLLYKREIYKFFNYIYSGVISIALSWAIFPWVIWHVFFNQMQKHTDMKGWSLEKVKDYVCFLNNVLFNGRGILVLFIVTLLFAAAKILKGKSVFSREQRLFFLLAFMNTVLFSFIIYTLDGDIWYYHAPMYLPFLLLFSVMLIALFKKLFGRRHICKEWLPILLSGICLIAGLSVSESVSFMNEYLEKSEMNRKYRQIAEEYKEADCIFVEQEQDNLFDNQFLEFGDYDEFKKISFADFQKNGIGSEELAGRRSQGKVILYIPGSYDMAGDAGYQFLADNEDYHIYLLEGA